MLTVYPAAVTIPDMVARLYALPFSALPSPPAVEVRDTTELPEQPGL